VSKPALGPTQPSVKWVPGVLSLGVKRPGREANHSPLSSDEVKCGAVPPFPNAPSWSSVHLNTGTALPLPLPFL